MRRPYTTTCRPFRDDPTEVNLVWYPAKDDAPVLKYVSAMNSLDQWQEPWTKEGVGEVYGAPRIYNGRKALEGLTVPHTCGTASDFAEGGVYDSELPPVEYDEDGIPDCCGRWKLSKGGGVGGGTATAYLVPVITGYKGAVGGGRASVWNTVLIRGSGGGVGGGVASVVYAPPIIAAGGGVGGGVASVAYTPPIVASGGAWGGGIADVGYALPIIGSGGAWGGGTADVGYALPIVGSGGAWGGGTASFGYALPITGSGGGVGKGTAYVLYIPPIAGRGGAVGGGVADVGYALPITGSRGGVGRGTATVSTSTVHTGSGGGVGKGTATLNTGSGFTGSGGGVGKGTADVTYTPSTPTPGTDCASSAAVSLGVTYSYTIPAFVQWWFKVNSVTNGANYKIETTGVSTSPAVQIQVFYGACPVPFAVTLAHDSTACRDFVAPSSGPIFIKFTGPFSGSTAITFKMSAGLC